MWFCCIGKPEQERHSSNPVLITLADSQTSLSRFQTHLDSYQWTWGDWLFTKTQHNIQTDWQGYKKLSQTSCLTVTLFYLLTCRIRIAANSCSTVYCSVSSHKHTHTKTTTHTVTFTPTEVSDCSNSGLHHEASSDSSEWSHTQSHTHKHTLTNTHNLFHPSL